MAAIVEVKYFNSFLLKKTVLNGAASSTPPIWNGSTGVPVRNPNIGSYPITILFDQNKSWFVE